MKINTTDIKTGGGVLKTLQPGNQQCTISSVELEEFKFREGGYHLVMHMEGPDMGSEFEGFFIDKDKESLGRHKGQVGKVKASEWAFSDGKTKTGTSISRDQEILKFMKNLCAAIGKAEWLTGENNKHDTIESLIKKFNTDKPFEGVWIKTCLAGKKYETKTGHTNYELFFPKYSKTGSPFEAIDASPSKLMKFNETEHIKDKTKSMEVPGFEAGSDNKTVDDFSLD